MMQFKIDQKHESILIVLSSLKNQVIDVTEYSRYKVLLKVEMG